MKKEELHSYFYSNVIARLKGVIDEEGYPVSDSFGNRDSYRVFQARPEEFQHQYQRERFLSDRDAYIAITCNGGTYHILTEKVLTGKVIVYKKDLEQRFPVNFDLALETLVDLLSKFYTVSVRDKSRVVKYDSSSGRMSSNGRFTKV